MSNLLKNLLIALGLAVILLVGYVVFLKDKGGSEDSILGDGSSDEAILETQKFVARLSELERMKIDVTIISDDRFASLVSFRQEIEDEPVGRTNPFAPLE